MQLPKLSLEVLIGIILSVLLIIGATAVNLYLSNIGGIHFLLYFLNYLPGLILAIIALILHKKQSSVLLTLLTVVFIGTSLLALIGSVVVLVVTEGTKTTYLTKADEYNTFALRNLQAWLSPSYSSFPQKLSASDDPISFAHYPQFIQGGSLFELRIKATPERRKELEKLTFVTVDSKKDNFSMYPRTLHTSEKQMIAINYELDWKCAEVLLRPTPPSDSDHGDFSFICISDTRNEILYFATEW